MARSSSIVLLALSAVSVPFVIGWLASPITKDSSISQPLGPLDKQTQLQFVGRLACAECHADIVDKYQHSGHANTFRLSSDSNIAKSLNGKQFYDEKRQTEFHYHFDSHGLSTTIPEKFGSDRFELTYALGSGTHGVTFLSLIPHESGGTLGIEHRVTYYGEADCLGITVGQGNLPRPSQDAEHFGKFVTGKDLISCIGCHTTTGHIEDHHLVSLIPNVGCESCHGAGSEHVSAMEAGTDLTKFDTRKKWPSAESELRACGKCHRVPESLIQTPLERSSAELVRFQPVGLMQSPCYKNSAGAMRCTTCHDPHAQVSKDTTEYNRICLDCHSAPSSTFCPTAETNCINCHMPAVSLGVASFHDHWIRVRNESDPGAVEAGSQSSLPVESVLKPDQ